MEYLIVQLTLNACRVNHFPTVLHIDTRAFLYVGLLNKNWYWVWAYGRMKFERLSPGFGSRRGKNGIEIT